MVTVHLSSSSHFFFLHLPPPSLHPPPPPPSPRPCAASRLLLTSCFVCCCWPLGLQHDTARLLLLTSFLRLIIAILFISLSYPPNFHFNCMLVYLPCSS